MYKMIVIDDEDIERECLASLIPWKDYGIEVADTAWNGIEGLEKIRALKPEIVITDIKMPVMSGIELIRKAKAEFPQIVFAVLSGYGEYEYTSQAMELGVRHYLLKPCKEEQIIKMAQKVRAELDEMRELEESRRREQSRLRRLKPRAQAQLFADMLEGREDGSLDYRAFLEEHGEKYPQIFLLVMKFPKIPDYLESFSLTNILAELMGEDHILLSTSVEQEAVYLLDDRIRGDMEPVAERVRKEYFKLFSIDLKPVISESGEIPAVSSLYRGIRAEGESTDPDVRALGAADTWEQVFFEVRLFLLKMKLGQMPLERQKDRVYEVLSEVFRSPADREDTESVRDEESLFEYLSETLCREKKIKEPEDKDARRVYGILREFYRNIGDPELSLQKLSREVMFMNKDYLGRLFYRQMKKRYSAYTVENRIRIAARLLRQIPDVRISQVAEECGYPADGQCFSRMFKKLIGQTPSEYKSGE